MVFLRVFVFSIVIMLFIVFVNMIMNMVMSVFMIMNMIIGVSMLVIMSLLVFMKSFVSMKMIMLMNVMTPMSLCIARFEEIIFIIKTWLLFFLCFCVQFGKFWSKLGGLEVRKTEFRFLFLFHWLPVEEIL